MNLTRNCTGAAAGLLLDWCLGEPPARWHPVAGFGWCLQRSESVLYADDRSRGVAHLGIGLGLGWAGAQVLRHPAAAAGLCIAGRGLSEAANEVAACVRSGDLEGARRSVQGLVGRDPDQLDADGVVRAVVESVAENTVDAVIAPMMWTVVAGSVGACCYRAVNTLDAMVGYRTTQYRRFGWASARVDDVANYLPARLTAVAVVAVRPRRWRAVLAAVRHDARTHPSPNAGVAEAAFAAALGCQLGGPTIYDGELDRRPVLGQGRPPGVDDIDRAVALSRHVTLMCALVAATIGAISGTMQVRSAPAAARRNT